MPGIRNIYQDFYVENLNNACEGFRGRELFVGIVVSQTNDRIRSIVTEIERRLEVYEVETNYDPLHHEGTYRFVGDNGNELYVCSRNYYEGHTRLSRIASVVIWDELYAGPSPRGTERRRFEYTPYRRGMETHTHTLTMDEVPIHRQTLPAYTLNGTPANIFNATAATGDMADRVIFYHDDIVDRFNEVENVAYFTRDELMRAMRIYDKGATFSIFDDREEEDLQGSPELDAYLEEMQNMKT